MTADNQHITLYWSTNHHCNQTLGFPIQLDCFGLLHKISMFMLSCTLFEKCFMWDIIKVDQRFTVTLSYMCFHINRLAVQFLEAIKKYFCETHFSTTNNVTTHHFDPPSTNGHSVVSLLAAPMQAEGSIHRPGLTDSINDQFWRLTTDQLCSSKRSPQRAVDRADSGVC